MKLLCAHTFWDWGEKVESKENNIKQSVLMDGRAAAMDIDWLQHTDDVLNTMIQLCCELTHV